MDSGTQDESGLIPGINPYLQNVAENSIDDLSGKNTPYESEMEQSNTYNMESNIEIHQGDNTFIQHTEYHQTTTTVTTEVYQESIPITQTGTEYMLEQGSENVYMPETSNVSAHEYTSEVVNDQVVDSVVNGNEAANNYVYEEQTMQDTYEEQVPQETIIQEEPTVEPISEEQVTEITEEHVTEEAVVPAPQILAETAAEQPDFRPPEQEHPVEMMETSIEDRNEESVDDSLVIADADKQEEPMVEEEVKEEGRESIVPRTADESPEHTMEVVEEATCVDVSDSAAEDPLSAANTSDEQPHDMYDVIETETTDDFAEHPEETLVLIHTYEDVTNESSAHASETHAEDQELADDPREETQSTASNYSDTSQDVEIKPRGRKSSSGIPLHILGHHLERPVDAVANGRSAKPRLGVKVPYRNLTSQIVSKEDIQKEIVERGRKKQMDMVKKENSTFAKQMTKRLANKLGAEGQGSQSEESQLEDMVESMQKDCAETEESTISEPSNASEIRDNNDLLAILEGDGDDMPPVLSKEVTPSAAEIQKLREMEKEIALEQLHDLPYLTPTQKPLKGRRGVGMVKKEKIEKVEKKESADKAEPAIFSSPSKPSNKENSTKTTADKKDITKKIPIEVEPQIKVNMALKTYSRKRKSSETIASPVEAKKPAPNDSVDVKTAKIDVPPPAYVTKSSRVIKKKVIWDPDDESRSPRPYSRSSDVGSMSPRPSQSKVEKPVEKPAEKKPTVENPKEEKKEELKKERRVYERVPKKETTTEKIPKKEAAEKTTKKEVIEKLPKKEAPEKVTKKEIAEKPTKKEVPVPEKAPKKDPPAESPKKSPVKYGKTGKKSKTEVDKLLGDEGAIKMLYDLKNDGEPSAKKKKDVISVTRTFKELRKRATELKNDLQSSTTSESPKNLRKKDSRDNNNSSPVPATNSPVMSPESKPPVAASISRQKSKDSARSSLHTPPPSPGFIPNTDTYLIRRRSSSSLSSSSETADRDDKPLKKPGAEKKKGKRAEVKREPEPPQDIWATEAMESAKMKLRKSEQLEKRGSPQYDTFSMSKSGKHINLDLHYYNKDSFCSVMVLKELTSALNKYARDKDCYVVSLTSSSTAFCLGLPYKSLVSDNEEEVKKKATELATHVRDFLLCLLHFPKILVAGIQGDCSGLAVTMLPLFDFVIASDIATFSTPYTALGCAAEAGFLLGLPQISRGFAAHMLYTSNVQSADEAFKGGLVSKLCWPEKYKETLKSLLITISKGSKQSLESNKMQLQKSLVEGAEEAIKAGTDQLILHWTSSECQKNFALRALGN